MEVLAGARSDQRESDLRRLLLRFELLPFEVVADFDGAAHIYRRCRRAGVTPRGMVDCMIAAVALRRGATLLPMTPTWIARPEWPGSPLRRRRSAQRDPATWRRTSGGSDRVRMTKHRLRKAIR